MRDRQQDEDERGDQVGREVERRGLADLRRAEDLDDAEDADEGRVLLQADEVVEQRRDDPSNGLGQDDEAHRLELAQPERAGGCRLARMDRLDARPVDLRDVRRVEQRERDERPEERRRSARPSIRSAGIAEPEDRDHEDARQRAEQVDVGGRQKPDREQRRRPAGCAGPRAPGQGPGRATSASRKSWTLTQNAPVDRGATMRRRSRGSKNDCWTRGQPGE